MSNPPEIFGFYSTAADREFEESTSSLRYFIEPKLPIDLNKGVDDLRIASDPQVDMGGFLKFIVNHKLELLNKEKPGNKLMYFTYRGVLRVIIRARVYRPSWSVIATKYRGNIYLCDNASQKYYDDGKYQPPYVRNIQKYPIIFKYHCLSEHPHKTPDLSGVSDGPKKFFNVLKRNLVNREFLIATKTDATDSETPLDPRCLDTSALFHGLKRTPPFIRYFRENYKEWKPNQFIALVMQCELDTAKRKWKFRNEKIHDIWALSYLAGCEKIHIGYRNDSGILRRMGKYSIDELEERSKRVWQDSMGGLEFLDSFLGKLEKDLEDVDCPYTTMEYHYDGDTKNVSSTKREGKSEYSFLPEWYLQEIN